MVHPAVYAVGIGLGIAAVLYTLLCESRTTEQPHQNHPSRRRRSFVFQPDPSTEYECPVCLENLGAASVQQLECGHRYHKKCIEASLKNRYMICALCRKPIKFD